MIIGLDIATRTGIAVGECDGRPDLWSERLGDPDSSHDERFAQMLRVAHRLITNHKPRLIAIERPIKRGRDKTATNELLMGLVACVRGLCYDRRVQCMLCDIRTVDKHFFGSPLKAGTRKRAISERVESFGWRAPDQDAADAALIWSFGCAQISADHSLKTAPLWQNQA